jgi:hypothetical protein
MRFTSTIAVLVAAACHGRAPEASRPSAGGGARAAAPPRASVTSIAPTPSAEAGCARRETNAAVPFETIELPYVVDADGRTTVEPEVAARFPAIREDGRKIAIIDERSSIDHGRSSHLALLDVATKEQTVLTLWRSSSRASQRTQA